MLRAGFTLYRKNVGWASIGPLAAIPRIPKLYLAMRQTAAHIVKTAPDLVVLVDFGAFNLRLATRLRAVGYAGPMLDLFPPATWLDNERTAREVARVAVPLTAFARQHEFYKSLGLPIAYFGHPLASRYAERTPPAAPAPDAGTVAILPGSRAGELRFHLPLLLAAYRRLRAMRPRLRAIFGAADDAADRTIRSALRRAQLGEIEIARGTQAAIAQADAAWSASGTAVLECLLSGVPAVALYVMSAPLARHARRVYGGSYVTLPNLVLDRGVVPELLQDAATPEALAGAMAAVLADPFAQLSYLPELRRALGPQDALERCAAFAVSLAKQQHA